MRTVFIHVADASQTVIEAALSHSDPGQSDPWIAYEAGDPALYIRIGRSENETDPDENAQLVANLWEKISKPNHSRPRPWRDETVFETTLQASFRLTRQPPSMAPQC